MVQLRNLPFASTTADVKAFLQDYQVDYIEIALIMSKLGKFRGLVNVLFKSVECAKEFYEKHSSSLFLQNRKVEIFPNISSIYTDISDNPDLATTVFINRLSEETTEDELRAHFSSCGDILGLKIAMDKRTGKSKVSD